MRVPTHPPQTVAELPDYLGAFTNYENLKALPKDRKQLGPERAQALIDKLGLSTSNVPVIQVAGSKGKGSTVLWMEALLLLRGQIAGCFLSPHLEEINERIRIAGEEIGDEYILAALREIHDKVREIETEDPTRLPTFFDLWLAVALYLFHRAKVDAILLEVGLGGPLDSTSAVPHQIGVLTSIDLEHRSELGDTLDEIAREKARIARADRPFIIAELSQSWGRIAAQQARSQGAEIFPAPIDHRVPKVLEAPQDRNLALALATLEALPKFEPFSEEEVQTAIAQTKLKGRLEELTGPPALLLDSAHTVRSMEYFRRRFITYRGARRGLLLVGFVQGKDWRGCLELFRPDGDAIDWIVTTPEPKRPVPASEVATLLGEFGGEVIVEEDLDKIVELMRVRAKQGVALGVSGSFYLSGKIRQRWLT